MAGLDPGASNGGGEIVAAAPTEDIAKEKRNYPGQFLAPEWTGSAALELKMTDSEVRGIILRWLYDIRHSNNGMIDIPDGLGVMNVEPIILGNCAAQLDEQGLIKFRQYMGRGYRAGHGSITAFGVDVVEGNVRPPIAVTIDNSISVSGSHGVQIGGHGNQQTVTLDVEKMISMVDSAGGTVTEKEEAKSLLKKLGENKIVQRVIGRVFEFWSSR
jgi:hypothetical protein